MIEFEPDNVFVRILREAQRVREYRQAQRDVRELIARTAWEQKAELLRRRPKVMGLDEKRAAT